MPCNKLKLNSDKTEVLCSGSRHSLSHVSETSLRVSRNEIPFKECVKNVYIYLDSTLSMHDHVSSVCKAASFELRKIASVRPYLIKRATVQLISSLPSCVRTCECECVCVCVCVQCTEQCTLLLEVHFTRMINY